VKAGGEMAKKKISIQSELKEIVNEMIEEYSRWDDIKKNGCSDPFWSDGCNINLVRNHIIYSKNEIRDFCTKNNLELPSEYFKPIPNEMSNNFMATPDKIKKDANEAYEIYCSTNLFEKLEGMAKDFKKEFKGTALSFIGYKIVCKTAIKNNNLIEMRRYNPERAKNDIKRAQELIKRNDIYKENEQLSLF
jgi:hypothetical protein